MKRESVHREIGRKAGRGKTEERKGETGRGDREIRRMVGRGGEGGREWLTRTRRKKRGGWPRGTWY